MQSASTLSPSRTPIGPVAWLGRSVLESLGYVGGVSLLLIRVPGWILWPWQSRREEAGVGFAKTLMHQLFWMLFMGIPLVAIVHIAVGSFLSLQAYYGSTFVDGTGAVVGVGLLRNLGGILSGMILAALLAARMIPELLAMNRHVPRTDAEPAEIATVSPGRRRESDNAGPGRPTPLKVGRIVAPRVAAAAVACVLLSLWGITVGTVVGWKASESLMGLSTEMYFMMMLKMMWYRDVLGLVFKGIIFGALPAAICCFEGLRQLPEQDGSAADEEPHPLHGLRRPRACPSSGRPACRWWRSSS